MESDEHGVVLAVGPDGVRDATLGLAAAEAVRLDTGIEVLHVAHSLVGRPDHAGQVESLDAALLRVGRDVLTDTTERLGPLVDGRPLTTELIAGPVAATITEQAASRDVVVLERTEPDRIERLLTMSVSTRVAAQAAAAVIVVPRDWTPAAEDLPVTVGVDEPADPVGQVEAAAAYAADVGRPLRVLFAMWFAAPYQDLLFARHPRWMWTLEADRELRLGLERLDDCGADVGHKVRWARPVDALVDASRHSSLLVLSRRGGPDHGAHLGAHLGAQLGSVSRAVLRHAECPVMFVDRS